MKVFNNFTDAYYDLISDVMNDYDYECAPREMKIREKIGASFTITDPRNRLPYIPERNFSISYYVGELVWYLAKRSDVKWIAKYSPFWLGVTDDNETVHAAYGTRFFTKTPIIANGTQVQWDRIVEELTNDPDSRRAVVYFGQPADHTDFKLDVGCTTAAQFFIRDKKLHQIVTMRSNDLILGTPYDVAAFTMFQELLALRLGVELGTYIHRSNSLHIYERNFPLAQQVLDGWNDADLSDLPPCPAVPAYYVEKDFKIPGIEKLIDFEKALWGPNCVFCANVRTMLDIALQDEKEQYWRDWACILAGHRAKKLTEDKKANRMLRRECFARAEFEGYKRFKK